MALIVYLGFKVLRLDRIDIDKKKRDNEAEKVAEAEIKSAKTKKKK